MSHKKVGHAKHDCRRDSLPAFHDHSGKYEDGDYLRCECGRVWYVDNARYCRYTEVRGRKLRKLISSGALEEQ